MFELVWWSIWYRNRRCIVGTIPDRPFVMIANHGSYLDWLLLGVLLRRGFRRKIHFLAKEDVCRNPVFRALVKAAECIVVEKSQRSRSLTAAMRLLSGEDRDGWNPIVAIFPEGTRSRSGEQLPAMPGAACLARRRNVPLVPVALAGFYEVWPPSRRLPGVRRGGLAVHFLPPVDLAAFPDDQAATDAAMNAIYDVVRRERRGQDVKAGVRIHE